MTTRKFNYTGRQRLKHADYAIRLEADHEGRYLYEVSATLDKYGFPGDAVIVVEAYERSRFERFILGAVESVAFPVRNQLALFAEGEAVKFRIKVIGAGSLSGRLLAEDDQIVPEVHGDEPGGRISLLRTEAVDLGDKVWELSLVDGPLLRLNIRLGDWRALVRSPEFSFMVYPIVLERIMEHVLVELGRTPDSDLFAWEQLWIRFASLQPGVPDFPNSPGEDDVHVRDWIDAAVEGFCRKNRLLRRGSDFCAGGGE